MTQRETALGPPVLAWLGQEGWEAYQEVETGYGCADIVATCGKLLAVVELKMALSFDLLWQARRWRHHAHFVWVAVPASKAENIGRLEAVRVFQNDGIGIVTVRWPGSTSSSLDVAHLPALNRRAEIAPVRDRLRPEQKVYAPAGTAHGRRWTPFKETCKKLLKHVTENPGVLLGPAVIAIQHHYANGACARAHLIALIRRGVITGIRIEKTGRKLRLFPEQAA